MDFGFSVKTGLGIRLRDPRSEPEPGHVNLNGFFSNARRTSCRFCSKSRRLSAMGRGLSRNVNPMRMPRVCGSTRTRLINPKSCSAPGPWVGAQRMPSVRPSAQQASPCRHGNNLRADKSQRMLQRPCVRPCAAQSSPADNVEIAGQETKKGVSSASSARGAVLLGAANPASLIIVIRARRRVAIWADTARTSDRTKCPHNGSPRIG